MSCSTEASCYALSFAQGRPVSTNSADTLADGMACRTPHPDALEVVCKGADRILQVTDQRPVASAGLNESCSGRQVPRQDLRHFQRCRVKILLAAFKA